MAETKTKKKILTELVQRHAPINQSINHILFANMKSYIGLQ